MEKKLLGRWGEEKAAKYMKDRKYRVIGMNYSCRFGEVDVIAENDTYVVFIEVKLRKDAHFAQAREFVTPAKQRRVMAAAQMWLTQNNTEKQPRFDVIEIYAPYGAESKNIEINHLENAF